MAGFKQRSGRPPVPGPIVIPGCVQAQLRFTDTTGTFSLVCHGIKGSTTVDETLANSLATSVASAVTSSGWVGFMAPGTSFDGVWVKDLSSANNSIYESNTTGVAAGGTGPALGDNTAICVTKQSAKSGKEFRGRMYLGGLDSSCTVDGHNMTDPAKVAAGNFGEAVRTAFNSAGIPMCIANRALQAGEDINGNPLPPRTANTTPITRLVVRDLRLDSQRRRLGR
jgi:hypothetical protein